MYFRLNPECFYIEGTQNGSIYDLIDGNLYSLNPEESRLVKKCEQNMEIQGNERLLTELEELCVGTFYDKQVHIEKIRIGSPIEDYQPSRPPHLSKVFLEINNTCNRSCWFCGYQGIKRSWGCIGCNRWNEAGEEISVQRWKEIIDDLARLQCQTMYLTGGDLTISWEKTIEILEYAHKKIPEIFMILNNSLTIDEFAKNVNNKARIIVQVNDTGEFYHKREINNDFYYVFPLSPDEYVKNIQFHKNNFLYDIVSDGFTFLNPNLPIISKSKLAKPDLSNFFHNTKYHPCLGNSLSISWKGDVLPCPLFRKTVYGNVKDIPVYQVIRNKWEKIDEIWRLNLSKVDKCGSCEFRLACTDCRVLESELTGDLYGKKLCSYIPHKGIWLS